MICDPGCGYAPHHLARHPCGQPWVAGSACRYCNEVTTVDGGPCPDCTISLTDKPLAELKGLFARADLSVETSMFTDCEKLRNFSESLGEWVQGYASRHNVDPDATRVAFGSLLRSIIKGLAHKGNTAAEALLDALVPSIDGAYEIAYGDLVSHLEAVITAEEEDT